jgi:predicted TIM-barrel fold metal-dependent hydrolase
LRIDAHHSYSERHPLEILKAILARNRFEGSILVSETFVPMWHIRRVDLADPALPRLLDEAQGRPETRGVLHNLAENNLRRIFPGLFELAHRRLPLDLEIAAGQLLLVPQIAEQYPTLRIVIDHLGRPPIPGPLDQWARGLECAARFPNIYCKLSGLTTLSTLPWRAVDLRPAVQHALAVFGPGRLMFGSDWPNSLPAATWKETLAAFTQSIGAQPMEVREQLLGGTAEKVYELSGVP